MAITEGSRGPCPSGKSVVGAAWTDADFDTPRRSWSLVFPRENMALLPLTLRHTVPRHRWLALLPARERHLYQGRAVPRPGLGNRRLAAGADAGQRGSSPARRQAGARITETVTNAWVREKGEPDADPTAPLTGVLTITLLALAADPSGSFTAPATHCRRTTPAAGASRQPTQSARDDGVETPMPAAWSTHRAVALHRPDSARDRLSPSARRREDYWLAPERDIDDALVSLDPLACLGTQDDHLGVHGIVVVER